MKDHSECKRKFIQLSKAWYADANLRGSDIVDEIMVGFYHPGGGTTGEFAIRWTVLGGSSTPMICSFEDSWSALWEFRDLLEKLSELDGDNPSPDEIAELLSSLGIENDTPTNSPYEKVTMDRLSLYSKPDSANSRLHLTGQNDAPGK